MKKRPEIGTVLWSVHEHLYYAPDRVGPVMEYCVCDAAVTGYYEGGFVEICVTGKSPDGYCTPYRYKLSDLGKCIFFTPREAAELAQRETERYERTWGRITGDPPMRRTWEKYLQEE